MTSFDISTATPLFWHFTWKLTYDLDIQSQLGPDEPLCPIPRSLSGSNGSAMRALTDTQTRPITWPLLLKIWEMNIASYYTNLWTIFERTRCHFNIRQSCETPQPGDHTHPLEDTVRWKATVNPLPAGTQQYCNLWYTRELWGMSARWRH